MWMLLRLHIGTCSGRARFGAVAGVRRAVIAVADRSARYSLGDSDRRSMVWAWLCEHRATDGVLLPDHRKLTKAVWSPSDLSSIHRRRALCGLPATCLEAVRNEPKAVGLVELAVGTEYDDLLAGWDAEAMALWKYWHRPLDAFTVTVSRTCALADAPPPLSFQMKRPARPARDRTGAPVTLADFFWRPELSAHLLHMRLVGGRTVADMVGGEQAAQDMICVSVPSLICPLVMQSAWRSLLFMARGISPRCSFGFDVEFPSPDFVIGSGSRPHLQFNSDVSLEASTFRDMAAQMRRWAPIIIEHAASLSEEHSAGERIALSQSVRRLDDVADLLDPERVLARQQHEDRGIGDQKRQRSLKHSASACLEYFLFQRMLRNTRGVGKALQQGMQCMFADALTNSTRALLSSPGFLIGPSYGAFIKLSVDLAFCVYRQRYVPDSERWGWADSSPGHGYDWLQTHCVEIEKTRVLEVFEAATALQQDHPHAEARHRRRVARGIAHAQTVEDLPETSDDENYPGLSLAERQRHCQVLRRHTNLHTEVPVAITKADLSHKCQAQVHKWYLESSTLDDLQARRNSYRALCLDMGTELGIPEFNLPDLEGLMPAWSSLPARLEPDMEDAEPSAAPIVEAGSFLPQAVTISDVLHFTDNLEKDLDKRTAGWDHFFSQRGLAREEVPRLHPGH